MDFKLFYFVIILAEANAVFFNHYLIILKGNHTISDLYKVNRECSETQKGKAGFSSLPALCSLSLEVRFLATLLLACPHKSSYAFVTESLCDTCRPCENLLP